MKEFKKLLPEKPLMKVVVGDDSMELQEATVPFSIGFDEKVAEMRPTHILVIAIPYANYENSSYTYNEEESEDTNKQREFSALSRSLGNIGERTLYELSKINYIQFSKPGKYNLLFLLLQYVDADKKEVILQKTSLRGSYQSGILLSEIARGEAYYLNPLAYSEFLTEIPSELFAPAPETKFSKFWWKWVNRGYNTKPVDECEFRKRASLAMTFKLVYWILGMLLRLVWGTIVAASAITLFLFSYIFGGHAKYIRATLKDIVRFVFLYPQATWRAVKTNHFFANGWNVPYKVYTFFGRKVAFVISPGGACIYYYLWKQYIHSLIEMWNGKELGTSAHGWFGAVGFSILLVAHSLIIVATYHPIKAWVDKKVDKIEKSVPLIRVGSAYIIWTILTTITFIAINYSALSTGIVHTATYTASNWQYVLGTISILLFITLILRFKKVRRWYRNTSFVTNMQLHAKQKAREQKMKAASVYTQKISEEQQRVQWYKQNMNIASVQKSVDIHNVIAPTKTEQFILKFKVSFWSMKAKICKPYART